MTTEDYVYIMTWKQIVAIMLGVSALITLGAQLEEVNPFATKTFVIVADQKLSTEINTSLKIIADDVRQDNIDAAGIKINTVWFNKCSGIATARADKILERHYSTFRANAARDHAFQDMETYEICPIVIAAQRSGN
jgi:hypothetical protein